MAKDKYSMEIVNPITGEVVAAMPEEWGGIVGNFYRFLRAGGRVTQLQSANPVARTQGQSIKASLASNLATLQTVLSEAGAESYSLRLVHNHGGEYVNHAVVADGAAMFDYVQAYATDSHGQFVGVKFAKTGRGGAREVARDTLDSVFAAVSAGMGSGKRKASK